MFDISPKKKKEYFMDFLLVSLCHIDVENA